MYHFDVCAPRTWASRFQAMASSRIFDMWFMRGVAICGEVYVPIPACEPRAFSLILKVRLLDGPDNKPSAFDDHLFSIGQRTVRRLNSTSIIVSDLPMHRWDKDVRLHRIGRLYRQSTRQECGQNETVGWSREPLWY